MLRRYLCVVALAVLASAPVSGKAQNYASGRGSVPNVDLYAGYSYVFNTYNPTADHYSTSGMQGWDVSLKIPIFGPFLGIKGDVSGQYYNNTHTPQFNPRTYFFLVGPQVGFHIGRSTLFAHGLVGSAHLTSAALPNIQSDNTLAVAVGGGLDLGLGRHFAWRVTGDYYNTRYQATDQNYNEIKNSNGRVSTGPVLRF